MKITTVSNYIISFSVQYFHETEGGMDHETYGKICDTLPEAIHLLELAKVHNSTSRWIIVCDVKNTISEK